MKPTENGTHPQSQEDWDKTVRRIDAPPVILPTIPCHRVGCGKAGTHMALRAGSTEYAFWCAEDVPQPPALIPPEA